MGHELTVAKQDAAAGLGRVIAAAEHLLSDHDMESDDWLQRELAAVVDAARRIQRKVLGRVPGGVFLYISYSPQTGVKETLMFDNFMDLMDEVEASDGLEISRFVAAQMERHKFRLGTVVGSPLVTVLLLPDNLEYNDS